MTPTEITQLARMSSALRYLSKTAAQPELPVWLRSSPKAPWMQSPTVPPTSGSSPARSALLSGSIPPAPPRVKRLGPTVPPAPPTVRKAPPLPYHWPRGPGVKSAPAVDWRGIGLSMPSVTAANATTTGYSVTPDGGFRKSVSRRALDNDFFSAEQFNKHLHNGDAASPRGQLGASITAQSSKQPVPWMSPNGRRLLQERNTLGQRQRLYDTLPEGVSAYSTRTPGFAIRDGNAYVNKIPLPVSDPLSPLGYHTIANHELEHATRQPLGGDTHNGGERYQKYTMEVGPSVGDLVFAGEQFRQDNGKPLQHTVKLPGGSEYDINWMIDRAKEHDYFKGRSMHELIFGTPEGQQWYKQQLERIQQHTERMKPKELHWFRQQIERSRQQEDRAPARPVRPPTQPSRPLWQKIFPPLPEGARPGQGW